MQTLKPKAWHKLRAEEAVELLDVKLSSGLSAEAVRRRQQEFGMNRVTVRRGTPAWFIFFQQFNQPLVYILLLATAVTAFLGEWVDSSVIFGVVLVNAFVGFIQEVKAEKAIEALSQMVVTHCTVRRDHHRQRVHSEELVPGDIVLLEAGDRVPADLRLFKIRGLQVDESTLTGESVPIQKHTDPLALETVLADRKNLAFAGTLVTAGRGEGVVWATGEKTETGRIAWLLSEAVNLQTPLTRKIAHFSKLLLWAILGLAAVTFVVGLLRGEKLVEMFMAAIALAVGAIPEGLPTVVTIVLALGVARMAKRRAIVRKLPAVETLGSTTVICSDKTGTLTENQMTVQAISAGGTLFEVTGSGYESKGEILTNGQTAPITDALAECLRAGVLCNDSQIVSRGHGRIRVEGDPTEAALLVSSEKAGVSPAETLLTAPRLDMIPFESAQMFRATLHDSRPKKVIYKAGAVERILDSCTDMLNEQGDLVALDYPAIQSHVDRMTARGLRVLAFARRHVESGRVKLQHTDVAAGLTFLGLQGMTDPPRPEAIAAIRRCQLAGIRVKMITGDHLATAKAIAAQIGLDGASGETSGPFAISGSALEKISDEELPAVAERTAVFARVVPEQKLRLVRALQSRGHVVAMTGDGVNDAPALKQADIGVAMGIGGTEVAKVAADIVLTDDNFASIEAAVAEGRAVFDNLVKYIVWCLPISAGQGLIVLTSILTGLALPALPVQLLWVNMATAILLGLTMAFESRESDLMARPPRDPAKPLLTFALFMRTGLVSLIMLVAAFGLFFWEHGAERRNLAEARTAVVNVIVLVQCFYLCNSRALTKSLFSVGLFSNSYLWLGLGAMGAAQLLFTYTPIMNKLFHTAPLRAEAWLYVFAAGFLACAVVEVEKYVRRQIHRMQNPHHASATEAGVISAISPSIRNRFSQDLHVLAGQVADNPVSVGELFQRTQGRGIDLLLILISLPFLTPIPLPGFSFPFGLIAFIIGARMAMGKKPWLPQKLLSGKLPPRFLCKLLKVSSRIVKWLESFLHPRLALVNEPAAFRRLAGVFIAACGLFLILPLPVPFSNSLPALTILLFAAGALERDGLAFLLGAGLFLVTAGFFLLLAFGGVEATQHFGDFFTN